jgi:hypothetical protein
MMAQLLFQVDLEGIKAISMGPLVREVFAKDAYNQFLGDRPGFNHEFLRTSWR